METDTALAADIADVTAIHIRNMLPDDSDPSLPGRISRAVRIAIESYCGRLVNVAGPQGNP